MLTQGQDLSGIKCEGACDRNTPLVSAADRAWLFKEVPRWELSPGSTSMSRRFTAKSFSSALAFFNAAGEVAEAEGHHPDLHLTNYRDVEVVVTTHAAGGLTHFDFVLAAKLDKVPVEYSPKWLRENPEPGA
ncbi:hypothetical protein FOA52_003706 [Chlamydomonas sp. UWO 241]|nr:hypothetical protein FOA52_003706 [Chlamydomonas sp. UWO 241]